MADGSSPPIVLCVACIIATSQGLPPLTACCGSRIAFARALAAVHDEDDDADAVERGYWEDRERLDAELPLDVYEEAARSGALDVPDEDASERRQRREDAVDDAEDRRRAAWEVTR